MRTTYRLGIGGAVVTTTYNGGNQQEVGFSITGLDTREGESGLVYREMSPDDDQRWTVRLFRDEKPVQLPEALSGFSSPEEAVAALQEWINE